MSDTQKMLCETLRISGGVTLVFGCMACLVAFLLIAHALLSMFQKHSSLSAAHLGNMQWIFLLAVVVIWAVSFHTGIYYDYVGYAMSEIDFGKSWIFAIIAFGLSLVANIHFASGHHAPPHAEGKELQTV